MRRMFWMGIAMALCLLTLHLAGSGEPADARADESTAKPATGFLYKTIDFGGKTYPFSVFVPPDYTPERAWPAILSLHGMGERGSDGFFQTDIGIGRAIRRNYRRCPAIVVMPQCPVDQTWDGAMLDLAIKCLEASSHEYYLDPQRVYLTGLSMGGAGSWRLAARMPNAFAAVVPICGFYGSYKDRNEPEALAAAAEQLARMPIWTFHGSADPAVPVERTREIVKAVRAAGGQIKYKEFPEVGHNVWDRAYDNPDMWRWMFSQRRETGTPATP